MAYKILTVDDSSTIRKIVKRALAGYNCRVLEAENGAEGLALAYKEHPDLILLDITMPMMSGIAVLEKLRSEKQLNDIPVIMLTAEAGKEHVTRVVSMGVSDYMVKPFKGDELIARAGKFLRLVPKQ